MQQFKQNCYTLLNSHSEIFFLQTPLAGAVILITTLLKPNIGISGMISVLAAHLFARLIGMDQTYLKSGFFTYNALLVGLSVGNIFVLTPLSVFFIVCAAILSLLLSVMLNNIFYQYFKLPILSIPFVIVSSFVYLASYSYSNLYVTGVYPHEDVFTALLPIWMQGFFISFGAILFLPNFFAGLIFTSVVFCSSRILFVLALMGYYIGALISSVMQGAYHSAFLNVNNFNYILIAMAIGGIFLVPSPQSFFLAAVAVAVATIFLDSISVFWANFGIPAFTLPFNFITLTFVYVLGLVEFPLISKVIRKTPEIALDEYISNMKRFKRAAKLINLPFSGSWMVWQGFDGKWTHKGSWRHAYDFIIKKRNKSYKNQGDKLEDFYAFKKPVLSPCKGRIIRIISGLPDNKPGTVDKANNWGNLVIIDTGLGYFVELSHFAQHSIQVVEGQWVETGTLLGRCGNSGYSAQPHIHVQVQGTTKVGSYTLPFNFRGYILDNEFVDNGLPAEEKFIEPLYPDSSLELLTNFALDHEFIYEAKTTPDNTPHLLNISVKMNSQGEFYFGTEQGKLFFNKDRDNFYFYRLEGNCPWLALLFSACPKIPLAFRQGMVWEDIIPVAVWLSGWQRQVQLFIKAFWHNFNKIIYRGSWESKTRIAGIIKYGAETIPALVILDDKIGFKQLQVGNKTLSKVI